MTVLPDPHDDLFAPLEDALARVRPALETAEIAHVLSVGSGVAEVAGFVGLRADELLTFPAGAWGSRRTSRRTARASSFSGRPSACVRAIRSAARAGSSTCRSARRCSGGWSTLWAAPSTARVRSKRRILFPSSGPRRRSCAARRCRCRCRPGSRPWTPPYPIGRGQRELILGDRQTGKTAIAVDTILNQGGTDVLSIYCAIGQRASAVARVIRSLREGGAMDRTIVVVAGGEDAPGLQFVAPYAATSMAEHFMGRGATCWSSTTISPATPAPIANSRCCCAVRRDARPIRETSSTSMPAFWSARRSCGRNDGGGSLTALPVVETQAQNLSAYIPTNLISITDGQIYLSPGSSRRGICRPSTSAARSPAWAASAVPAFRAVAGHLRLIYAQFEELETFARFGAQLDAETRRKLARGLRVREVLKQAEHEHVDVPEQIAGLLAATEGLFDALEPGAVAEAERTVREAVRAAAPGICDRISDGAKLGDEDRAALVAAMRDMLSGARTGDDDGDA